MIQTRLSIKTVSNYDPSTDCKTLVVKREEVYQYDSNAEEIEHCKKMLDAGFIAISLPPNEDKIQVKYIRDRSESLKREGSNHEYVDIPPGN